MNHEKVKLDWEKVIKKGFEGALIAGGAGGAATQDGLVTLLSAVIGFLFKAGKNWLKNK